jgi:hypothetical protein
MNESYPNNWKHATIHLNPETGELHSDGDHSVRVWIAQAIRDEHEKGHKCENIIEVDEEGKVHGCERVHELETKYRLNSKPLPFQLPDR